MWGEGGVQWSVNQQTVQEQGITYVINNDTKPLD